MAAVQLPGIQGGHGRRDCNGQPPMLGAVGICWQVLANSNAQGWWGGGGGAHSLNSAQREKPQEYYFLTKAVEREKQVLERLSGAPSVRVGRQEAGFN